MLIPRDLLGRLLEFAEEIPLVDICEHFSPLSSPEPVEWFLSFLEDALLAAGLSPFELKELKDSRQPLEKRLAKLSRLWPVVRTTAPVRALSRAAWDLFGLEAVTPEHWPQLLSSLSRTNDPGYQQEVLAERGRFQEIWTTAVDDKGDDRFRPLADLSPIVSIVASGKVADLAHFLSHELASLQDLTEGIQSYVQRSGKDNVALLLSVPTIPIPLFVREEEAAWAFTQWRWEEEPSGQARGILLGYVLTCVMDQLKRAEIAVFLETDNVPLVAKLSAHYPHLRFVLLDRGTASPYTWLSVALGSSNLYLALGKAWLYTPLNAKQALALWVQALPIGRVIALAGKMSSLEGAYAVAVGARQGVGETFSQLVASALLDENEAREAIRSILLENALALRSAAS